MQRPPGSPPGVLRSAPSELSTPCDDASTQPLRVRRRGALTYARRAVSEALAVLLPIECAGCGVADRGLCDTCRRLLQAHPVQETLPGASADRDVPLWTGLRYEGAVAQIIASYKDGGRSDLAGVLSKVLRSTIAAASADFATSLGVFGSKCIELVTIPSTPAAYRRRGWRPVERLLQGGGLRASGRLRLLRATADQVGLGLTQRGVNRRGSLKGGYELAGRIFIIVDDIATSGATLREAARALREADAIALGAACLARTPRRDASPSDSGSSDTSAAHSL